MRDKLSMIPGILFKCIVIVHTTTLLILAVIEAIHLVRLALAG